MGKPLAIPQKQITALCKGAAAAGFVAEVKIGGVVVRLIPADRAQADSPIDLTDDPENFQSLDDYLGWRDRNLAGEN